MKKFMFCGDYNTIKLLSGNPIPIDLQYSGPTIGSINGMCLNCDMIELHES